MTVIASLMMRSAQRRVVLPRPPSSTKVGGRGGALAAPRSIHHRLRSTTTANLPIFTTRGDALRATSGTSKQDHLRGERRLIDNTLCRTDDGHSQFVRKARQLHTTGHHLGKLDSDGPVPESIHRDSIIESYEDVISNMYERGRQGLEGEIPWRRFPLDGSPKVIRGAADNAVAPAPDGVKGRQEQHHEQENSGKGFFHPAHIEEAICKSRFISQVVVVCGGSGRPYNVALVVPDWVAVRIELGMPDEFISEEDLAKSDSVRELIDSEIKRNCYNNEKTDIPAAFAFVAPFTADRDFVMESYGSAISDLYERGSRGSEKKGEEIRWRYFPLGSGPKVAKGTTDETIAPPPSDGNNARRFHHDDDLGKLESDGSAVSPTTDDIMLTGEQYALEDGTCVRPGPIEEAICKSRFVRHVVVCGSGRPHNVGLIVPDWASIRIELGMPPEFISEEEMTKSEGVRELIGMEIKRNCYNIENNLVPATFAFVAPFAD